MWQWWLVGREGWVVEVHYEWREIVLATLQDIHGIGDSPGYILHCTHIQQAGIGFEMAVVPDLLDINVPANRFTVCVKDGRHLLHLLRPSIVQQGSPL